MSSSYDDCCKVFTIIRETPVCKLIRMNVKFFRGESLVFYGSMALSERGTNPCVVKVRSIILCYFFMRLFCQTLEQIGLKLLQNSGFKTSRGKGRLQEGRHCSNPEDDD